jgi:hypothetical protein
MSTISMFKIFLQKSALKVYCGFDFQELVYMHNKQNVARATFKA